uniref:ICOS ligand n=1 Tax=Spermophilus dauricus TaxID=99837 RepID=A0A8C9PQY2_SPEDA
MGWESPSEYPSHLWTLAVIEAEEVRALVGSDVKLSCVYPGTDRFDLDDLFVYWQVSESNAVVTYYLPENSSTGLEDSHYKNRAHLSLDSMQQGDFSLHLRNVTPQDEQKFKCLVFRKSLELGRILEAVVTLHVAANYSMPVVSTPSRPSAEQELTFTCVSTDGYPRPSVYWINKTDNSQLDKALHNDTVSLNQRGLYDVVSVLRIPWAPSVNVGCCIENALLHQNLTGTGEAPAGGCGDWRGPTGTVQWCQKVLAPWKSLLAAASRGSQCVATRNTFHAHSPPAVPGRPSQGP